MAPEFCAADDRLGRKFFILALGVLSLGLFIFDDYRTIGLLALVISVVAHVPFIVALVAKRAYLIGDPVAALPDDKLPKFSILVPVYHEANMMAQLARSLAAIDYPHDRLEAFILIEANDPETYAAAMSTAWSPFVRVLTVRAEGPQTKPRACNFGLAHARGRHVVIYDAEDQPHPSQLREAATRFHDAPCDVACLQAPLIIDKGNRDWLTAMFALEYRLLFTRFLPILSNYDFVIPLGGTSNHFRADILRAVGAWDSHNLTEDAELGMRLAYFGFRTEMITKPTFENAPHRLKIFLRQRIRWQSGHIQTISVHARQPRRAINAMGAATYVFFMLVLMCRITNPIAHIFLIGHGATIFAAPDTLTSSVMVISVNVCLPYFALAYRALDDEPKYSRLLYVLSLPAYWLLIAPATVIAVYRMARGQTAWMKTPHKPFRRKI